MLTLIGGERSHTNPNRHVLYIAVLAGALPVTRPDTVHSQFHNNKAVSHDAQNGFSWRVKEDAGTDMKL